MMKTMEDVKKYIRDSNRESSVNISSFDFFISHWKEYIKLRKLDGDSGPQFPRSYGIEEREEFYKDISFGGWGGASGHDSVIIAYDALLGCDGDWNELCKRGVLHGGDNDSTGTIAAAWFGAVHGFKESPSRTIRMLNLMTCVKSSEDKL
eukprot:TRINITY_DN4820_c0_g1_i2.p1 TRINITY_DN4820_c0_g1~~TRINITY_DN4820_c0_g1_i2.p1  ORF type:complete len:150 (-),score=21.82 TRINITY_DN4820_c0_g1_i2:211-660(-)